MRSLSFTQRFLDGQADELHRSSITPDDYSSCEIAEEFGVSRQAVYDNIKRTENFEDYEVKLHMYSDYIVRSHPRSAIRKILFYRSHTSSIDDREWLWAVTVIYQGIPCKLLVAEEVFLLDYRLSRPMISQSYANRFSCWEYPNEIMKKSHPKAWMFAFRTISTELNRRKRVWHLKV